MLCRRVVAVLLGIFAIAPSSAGAQDEPDATPRHEENVAIDTVSFLAGGALAFGLHEAGHLVFDAVYGADPRVVGVNFGPFPFFAVTHRSGMPPGQEYAISSAGFWVQEGTNEWLLTKRPRIRDEHAPFAKGMIAFNVLTSIGYAIVAFTKSGPVERDTRGMTAIGVDERVIGVVVITPALLDGFRYFNPDVRWLAWASRASKIGGVLLAFKQ